MFIYNTSSESFFVFCVSCYIYKIEHNKVVLFSMSGRRPYMPYPMSRRPESHSSPTRSFWTQTDLSYSDETNCSETGTIKTGPAIFHRSSGQGCQSVVPTSEFTDAGFRSRTGGVTAKFSWGCPSRQEFVVCWFQLEKTLWEKCFRNKLWWSAEGPL